MDLSKEKCIPCQGGVPPLDTEEINKLITSLNKAWYINNVGHLIRDYKFHNFKESMVFANKVAEIAEEEGHHPDLYISYGKCTIEIWTHKINGLTRSDFILASKIDKISE